MSWSGELQRNLIFVEVALVVGTESHEHRQLVVLQVCGVLFEGVGMHEHLQTLILSEVEVRVLVYCLCLTVREVCHLYVERLLVALCELRLRRVLLSTDARRQHVVHRHSVVVLLDVHGADCHLARLAAGTERLLIDAPLSPHEVEASESQNDRLLEVGEEHTHESYGGEVCYSAYVAFVVVNRYAELIPRHCFRGIVAQFH
ncbi:unknown [Prevotella sp. CAG:592]|nr:unknown [Prevotella sp. CAG:592]